VEDKRNRLLSSFIHRIKKLNELDINSNVLCFVFGATAPPPSGPGPLHSRGFWITHNDASQSVGLIWTSDQIVAKTST